MTIVLGIALRAVGDAAARDFRHDIAWYRYGAALELRRQGDHWYPWSAPLLERWARSDDPVRAAYAEDVYERLGGWPAQRRRDAQTARKLATPAPAASARAATPAPSIVLSAIAHANGVHRDDAMLRAALDAADLHPVGAIDDDFVALKLAVDFPQTRYVRAMKEYDAIRGGTYFGDERGDTLPSEPSQRFARALRDETLWRSWLSRYADHPGADDATYWLARSLEMQARRAEALGVLASALSSPVGDGDMARQLWSRALYLLDVGIKDADLDAWLQAHHGDAFEPVVSYARGVRYARLHQYGKAAEQIGTLPAGLRALEARWKAMGRTPPFDTEHVIATVFTQNAIWRKLSNWVIYTVNDLHPELRELVIQEWTKPDGWTIPYLALYDGARWNAGPDVPYAIEPNELAENYRRASAVATALALTNQNLADTVAGAWTREHDRYRIVALLYEQATQHPDRETAAMHPLPGFVTMAGADVKKWYVGQAAIATAALLGEFPKSTLADSALMCMYELSGDRKYLEDLLQRYPDGDRAEEARAALYVATHSTPSH